MSCLITMSQKELHRLEVVQRIRERRLTVTQAGEQLCLSRSQVHRLLQAYDRDGADGLVSKRRGRPSNRRHSEDFRNTVLDLVREHYRDFGPTLASKKLIERHHLAARRRRASSLCRFGEYVRLPDHHEGDMPTEAGNTWAVNRQPGSFEGHRKTNRYCPVTALNSG